MFQNLRAGNQVYILHKDGHPSMDMGSVVSVSMPVPKYQVPPVFGQPQEMVVDLVVKVNNVENTYQKLPATSDIADFGPSGIVISSSREAMNAEVLSLKTRSTDAINSIDYHRGIIEGCESILSSLYPEYAERQQQAAEINDLKAQLSELMEINRNLLSRLDSGLPAK